MKEPRPIVNKKTDRPVKEQSSLGVLVWQ